MSDPTRNQDHPNRPSAPDAPASDGSEARRPQDYGPMREGERFRILRGDCVEAMARLLEEGVRADALICDPPYGLSKHGDVAPILRAWLDGEEAAVPGRGFLEETWDAFVPSPRAWGAAMRLAKPGAHLAAFAGTRSTDLMGISLRLAGWEMRDVIAFLWSYATGMGKGRDLSMDLDRLSGTAHLREVVGTKRGAHKAMEHRRKTADVRIPVSRPHHPLAKAYEGWTTSLRPSFEPILLGRAPFSGSVAECVAAHGTGAMNVGGCRVLRADGTSRQAGNLLQDGSEETLRALEEASSGLSSLLEALPMDEEDERRGEDPSASLRGEAWEASLHHSAKGTRQDRHEGAESVGGNRHPCLKPTPLLRWLVRLLVPDGGLVVDPFCGSGSVGKAVLLENPTLRYIGIELDPEHAAVAEARCRWAEAKAREDAALESEARERRAEAARAAPTRQGAFRPAEDPAQAALGTLLDLFGNPTD